MSRHFLSNKAHVRGGDHYVGAEMLLPRGDKMARGHIVAWIAMLVEM